MTTAQVALTRDDRGATTAEYAVVTAAGCGFGAVLLRLLMSDWGQALLKKVFEVFLGMIGVA
jgi:Flp pilus assembly pilin Flp